MSAGLLAPVIGAGLGAAFTTIGIGGATGFLASTAGAAVITTGGVLTGSGIAARGMARRTQFVRTFDILPLHNNKRVNCILTVPGYVPSHVLLVSCLNKWQFPERRARRPAASFQCARPPRRRCVQRALGARNDSGDRKCHQDSNVGSPHANRSNCPADHGHGDAHDCTPVAHQSVLLSAMVSGSRTHPP